MTLAPGKDPVLLGKVPAWCGHVRPLVTHQTELQPSKSGHDAKDPLRPVPGYARMQKPRRLRMELRRGGDCNLHGSAAHRVSWQRGTRHDYTPLDVQETVERVKQVDAHGEA